MCESELPLHSFALVTELGNRSAQWFRTAKNRDVNSGPLARPYACSLAPPTHSLAPHCSIRSLAFYLQWRAEALSATRRSAVRMIRFSSLFISKDFSGGKNALFIHSPLSYWTNWNVRGFSGQSFGGYLNMHSFWYWKNVLTSIFLNSYFVCSLLSIKFKTRITL